MAGYALIAFTHSIPMLVLAGTVLVFGGLVRPTLTSLISHTASREEQGVVMGLTQSINSISQIAAPPLAGWMIGHNLLGAWGIVAALVAAAGLALALQTAPMPGSAAVEIDT